MSPLVSASAALQSIIPAPVRSRSSLTCDAEMLIVSPFTKAKAHRMGVPTLAGTKCAGTKRNETKLSIRFHGWMNSQALIMRLLPEFPKQARLELQPERRYQYPAHPADEQYRQSLHELRDRNKERLRALRRHCLELDSRSGP